MRPTLRKTSNAFPRNYPASLKINNKMFGSIRSAGLITLVTWWLIACQLFLILADMAGSATTPLRTIALLNFAAIFTFIVGFCLDLFIFLLPVIVSTLLTALFLWYRINELVQLFNKAVPTSAKWI